MRTCLILLLFLVDLTAYDTVKHAIMTHTPLKDHPVTHALASLFSGIIAAIFATPAGAWLQQLCVA